MHRIIREVLPLLIYITIQCFAISDFSYPSIVLKDNVASKKYSLKNNLVAKNCSVDIICSFTRVKEDPHRRFSRGFLRKIPSFLKTTDD